MIQNDILFFILKYTPWWAVPIMVMATQFAYVYWLKDYRPVSVVLGILAFFCLVMIIFYFLLGGPNINQTLLKTIN